MGCGVVGAWGVRSGVGCGGVGEGWVCINSISSGTYDPYISSILFLEFVILLYECKIYGFASKWTYRQLHTNNGNLHPCN